MSTDIEPTTSAVPALASTPALEIGAADIALPRIKLGQFSTPQVQDELVTPGQIFATTGDGDAELLYDPAKKTSKGLLVHVLSMYKRKSLSADGELSTWAFNDPDAPSDAWVTYNYVVCLPEVDDSVPYKWLLTRSGSPAAKQINTVLAKNVGRGPAHSIAFRITTLKKENDKGKWFIPRIAQVEAKPADVAASEALAGLVASSPQEQPTQTGVTEPAI